MKVLITGASGFAGSHLAEALATAGYTEIYGTAFGNVNSLTSSIPKDHIFGVNLTDRLATEKLIKELQPDWVFHLAALAFVGKSFEKAAEVMSNNVTLQLNVLEAIRQHVPQARVLAIGSAEEYGLSEDGEVPINESHPLRPVNPYAVSKVSQDLLAYSYAVSYKMNILRVRPFNHIGERQTDDFAIPAFAKQIVQIERGGGKEIKVGNLKSIRDFTDVKDMVRAYIAVMEKGKTSEVYNIGSGQGTSMENVLEKLISYSTSKVEITRDESRMRPNDIPVIIADTTKIRSLGWQPTIPLDNTLKRVMEYWRSKET